MLHKQKLLVAAVAGCLVAPSAFATNGYFAHGYGTKSKALAGAGVALPQDSLYSATNPAGGVWVGHRLDAGAALFSPHREFKATDVPAFPPGFPPPFQGSLPGFPLEPGKTKSDSNYFLIPTFGWNKMLSDDAAFGVAVYGNGGMNTDYDDDPVSAARGEAVDKFVSLATGQPVSGVCQPGVFCAGKSGVDLSQLFVNLSYSRKFANDKASWGAGLILAAQRFKAKGLAFFSPFTETAVKGGIPTKLTNNGYDWSYGAGLKIGAQGEVYPGVTLAASYQTKTWMTKFDDYKDLFANGGEFDIPPTATIGLAWKPAPQHTLLLDYQYIWYESVDAISNPNDLATRCSPLNPSGFNPSYCLGGSKGAGFGWENTGVIKVGWQFEYNPTWTFRLGYSHNDQPIPKSEVVFNTLAPGVVENHITAGFTQKLSKKNEWSLSAMYAPKTDIKGRNQFTGAPDGSIPAQDVTISMDQWEIEASFGFLWD